jgi:hypothetical protein
MGLSDLAEVMSTVGVWVGAWLRLYALGLCVCALAAAQRLTLLHAWAALLVPVAAGLVLGVAAGVLFWPLLVGFRA